MGSLMVGAKVKNIEFNFTRLSVTKKNCFIISWLVIALAAGIKILWSLRSC